MCAFIQNSNVPTNKIFPFSIPNFTGGLNNRSSYLRMDAHEASDLLNIVFKVDGTFEKRKGFQLYDDFVIDDPEGITYMDIFKPINEEHYLVRASNSQVYIGETKIADVNGQIHGVNYIGKYYFVDGVNFYMYGKKDSEPTTEYKTYKVVNPPKDFTPKDTSHKEGEWKYDDTKLEAWYEPCQNEIDDPYMGSNVVPAKCKYILIHNERLILSGDADNPHTIYISDINNGFYFPNYVSLQLPPNSDEIVGMRVFHSAIVVGRTEDVYVIYGDTNRLDIGTPFYMKKVNTHTGFTNQDNIQSVNNYLYYLGNDGEVYSLYPVRGNTDLVSTKHINDKVDFFVEPLSFKFESIKNTSGIFFDNDYWLSFGNKILVYSFLFKAWTVFDGIQPNYFLHYENELLIADKSGKTYKYGYEYNDNGQVIPCYWYSKHYDMGQPSRIKQFRQLFVVAHSYEEWDSDIKLRFEIDYVDVKDQHVIKNQISRFGKARFGINRFITRNIAQSLPVVIGQRGRLLRVIIANDELNQTIKIYEINGEYELRGFR